MKKLFFLILSAVFLAGCQNNSKTEEKTMTENSLFETTFGDFKEIDALADYEKESDTSIYMGDRADTYRLMNLRKNGDYLVLFYKGTGSDSANVQPISYTPLDTIQVKDLNQDERVSLGYCQHEDYDEGEVFAVVKGVDSIQEVDILRAWKANPESEIIEELRNLEGIECLNEFFKSENSTIPIEEMS